MISVTLLVPSLPSSVARSPAYWRTMIGLDDGAVEVAGEVADVRSAAQPDRVARRAPHDGWSSAVWKSQGLPMLPLPDGLPFGAT